MLIVLEEGRKFEIEYQVHPPHTLEIIIDTEYEYKILK